MGIADVLVILIAASAAVAASGCMERMPDADSDVGSGEISPGGRGGVGVGLVDDRSPIAVAARTADSAPSWDVGDHWTFVSRFSGEEETSTYVVTSAGSGFVLSPVDPDTAVYDAFHDISFVGRIGPDLSGRQGDDRVAFYTWPLVDGTAWTTRWDGEEVALTAHANPAVSTPGGAEAGFDVVGTVGNDTIVRYNYAPSVGWWTRIEWPPAGHSMVLVDHGKDYAGAYYEAEEARLVEKSVDVGPLMAPGAEFEVTGVPAALQVVFTATSAHGGALLFDVEGPSGDRDQMAATCTTMEEVCRIEHVTDLAPAEGAGRIVVASTLQGAHHLVARAAYVTEKLLGVEAAG